MSDTKIFWCNDIEMRKKRVGDIWIYDCWTLSYDPVPISWTVCPICSAPRPVNNPKSMWVSLMDKYVSTGGDHLIDWKAIENAAKDWIRQRMPGEIEVKTYGYVINPKISSIEQSIGYSKAVEDIRKSLEV